VTVCGCASWEVHVRYQKGNDRDNIRNCLRNMGFENKVKGTTYILCPMAGFLIVCVQLHGLAVSVPSFARNLTLNFENFIYIYNIPVIKLTTLIVYNEDRNQNRLT